MNRKLRASDIANFLNSPLLGQDIEITGVSMLSDPQENTLTFSKASTFQIPSSTRVLVLIPPLPESVPVEGASFSCIRVKNPRLAFAKTVSFFFPPQPKPGIHPSTSVGENTSISATAVIGAHCTIAEDVTIGAGTVINSNVVIAARTEIGCNCYIKSNSVIGEEGFGFDFEEDGTPVRLPHLGNVRIGNNVEIGSNTIIARGTIGTTSIEDNVKIDDLCLIAHNCRIGRNTIITGGVQLGGSCIIGTGCWLSPNATILNKLTLGDRVTVGIGSVIINDIPDDAVYMCNEAFDLVSLRKWQKETKYHRRRENDHGNT